MIDIRFGSKVSIVLLRKDKVVKMIISGSSLVATPDFQTEFPGSNAVFPQPTVYCQSLEGLPSGMELHSRLFSEVRQRRRKTRRASGSSTKKKKTWN